MKKEIKELTKLTYGNGITSQINVFEAEPTDNFLGSCSKLEGDDLDIYEIILNKTGDLFLDSGIELHEFGHIYLNQLDIWKSLDEQIRDTINKNKSKIATKINENCGIDFGDTLLDQIIEDPRANQFIHNVSMDLEVNSKIIGEEDIKEMERRLERIQKVHGFKLVYPSKYNLPDGSKFPENRSYPEYLILVIQNLDQFLKQIQEEIKSSGGNEKDLEEILESMGNFSEDKEKESNRKDPGSEIFTENLKLNSVDPINIAIDDVIRRYRKKTIKKDYKKDFLYHYNRGINRSVISPIYRLQREQIKDIGIVFLIDVSGSMRKGLIDSIISGVRDKMLKIRSNIRYSLVGWSTELTSEFKDITGKSKIPEIKVGGGTRISTGISYIDKNYSKSDILVIISDFYDDLDEWEKITSKISDRDMYGFCYGKLRNPIKIKNLIIKNFNDEL